MLYDLSNKFESQNAQERLNWLMSKCKKVNITEKRARRTTSQNSYQHVLFSYYALHTGYTANEVKQDIYKRHINRDMFVRVKNNINVCRSTADLNTKETAICIDKFIDRALIDLGLNLPLPHEKEFLDWCENEIGKYGNSRYL